MKAFALLCLLFSSFVQASRKIEIFTLSNINIANVDIAKKDGWRVTSYLVDGALVFERQLSAGLPADREKAMEIAKARVESMKQSLGDRAIDSYQGQLKAVEMGVNRLPAIVFNKTDVIYGVTDLWEALRIYGQTK